MSRILKHRNEYSKHGYTIVKKIFSKDMAKDISDEINVAVNVKKYYDQKGTLRRIERVFDKGKTLRNINDNILILLSKIFEKDFTIFKDKCNAKPPGGEGFYAHYDGIFLFKNSHGNQEKGWYKYTDFFVNVLIALDDCNIDNGTIEIADAHKGTYDELLLNTKQNGTPDLIKDVEDNIDFNPIELKPGDIVVFSNTCPHRSKKNKSSIDRRTLYYTYSLLEDGSFYDEYFNDKESSKNTSSKSLSGES
jgi:ectoine hydroxylase-related dioxygenase (phytanoyl-CoA dioxygenase family)